MTNKKLQKVLIILSIVSAALLLCTMHKFHRDENADHQIMLDLVGNIIPHKLTSVQQNLQSESVDLRVMLDLMNKIKHQLEQKPKEIIKIVEKPVVEEKIVEVQVVVEKVEEVPVVVEKVVEVESDGEIQDLVLRKTPFIPVIPPYHLPSRIRKNPDLEALFCANGTYDCIDFPEVASIPTKFFNIDFPTYSKIINLPSKHTNP